ncbi:uncharacterized protein [Anoplolepis gracilipes]|uniref:uncharacterized protein n=1 Tax=Anoplolepis gracilipes TaxID=354296 RepID=UPI003B9F96B0
MAKDSIDGILVRLDEIEKLQAELRHLVPRVTSNSSKNVRHQDLSRDTTASIRFPSLFTFPVISNFTSSSRNDRVQKSVAQMNLNDKLSSDNQPSTTNVKNARKSSRELSTRETNIFKNLLKSTDKRVARLHAGNSLASTSVINSRTSKTPTKSITANRVVKDSQGVIRKELKSKTSKIVARDMQRINDETSSMRLSGNNTSSIHSSVQTSVIQIHAKPRDVRSCLRKKRNRDRKEISMGTLIQRIMKKLNYPFADDNRVTIPYHYPGNRKPRRVQGTRLFAVKSFVD